MNREQVEALLGRRLELCLGQWVQVHNFSEGKSRELLVGFQQDEHGDLYAFVRKPSAPFGSLVHPSRICLDASRSTVVVELEIAGDHRDALYVVDELVGEGVLQDAINDHELDAGPLRVKSAVALPGKS